MGHRPTDAGEPVHAPTHSIQCRRTYSTERDVDPKYPVRLLLHLGLVRRGPIRGLAIAGQSGYFCGQSLELESPMQPQVSVPTGSSAPPRAMAPEYGTVHRALHWILFA